LQNGDVYNPAVDKIFHVVAANTFGMPTAGHHTTQRIECSTQSRFMRIRWDIDEEFELAMLPNRFGTLSADEESWARYVQKLRATARRLGVKSMIGMMTPRSTENAIMALRGDFSKAEVEDMAIWIGVPEENARKVQNAL
jgi:hypothetical protein